MSVVRTRVAAAGALALALTAGALAQGSMATGIPANKVAASGSETEVIGANQSAVVLSETVKINNPTDLILGVSLECAILTQVTNSANGQTERAFGEIKIHVTINGRPVPVSDADADAGRVVFCNRAQEQQWTDTATGPNAGDDSEDQLRQYLSTRTANSFNWLALNVGTEYGGTQDNVHKIEVVATWTTSATGEALAEAVVGNRTLVLEPVKAAVGERVTELG
jgi:hypothetical protein